jgi:hypothetical protein
LSQGISYDPEQILRLHPDCIAVPDHDPLKAFHIANKNVTDAQTPGLVPPYFDRALGIGQPG